MPKQIPLKRLTGGPVAARTRLKLGSPMYQSWRVHYPDSWPLLHKARLFPKLPLKLLTGGPVAARTRLKLGSPIYRSRRVQYPDSWPLLHKARLFSKLQSSEKKFPLLGALMNEDERKDTGNRKQRAWQKAIAERKIRGSYIDFVTLKSRNATRSSHNKQKSNNTNTQTKSRRKKSYTSRNTRRRAKNRKAQRRSRRSGKTKRGQKKTKGRTKCARRVSQRQAKRKSRNISKKRTRRSKRRRDHSAEGQRRLEAEPPLGHAQDYMLKQKNTVNTEYFDVGHDVIKDDPLNINDICRRLVKSLPCVPADCREEKFDEKTTRPEHKAREIFSNRTRAIDKHCTNETKGLDDTLKTEAKRCGLASKNKKNVEGRNCVRKVKALLNDYERGGLGKLRNKSRANGLKQSRQRRKMQKSLNPQRKRPTERPVEKMTAFVNSSRHDEKPDADNQKQKQDTVYQEVEASAENAMVEQKLRGDEPQDKMEGMNMGYKRTKATQDCHEKDKTDQQQLRRRGKNKNVSNVRNREEMNASEKPMTVADSRAVKTNAKVSSRISTRDHKHHMQCAVSLRQTRRKKVKPATISVPYHGKPVPRNRRREDIHIIQKQGRDIRLFVKRGQRGNGSSKTRRRTAKRQPARRPNRASDKKTAKRQVRGAKVCRREREENGDNTNNNQTESRAWGRVSERLLRIGRYLLRKFKLYLW